MSILILIILLAAVSVALKAKPFEFVFSTILVSPIIGFIAGKFVPLTGLTYIVIFIISATIIQLFFRNTQKIDFKDKPNLFKAYSSIGIFILLYLIIHTLAMRWPDFMPMGERLRDYAILGSVIKSPVIAQEPWMTDANLNYYLYWYRFGQMISAIFNQSVWDTYHFLVSFSLAFYITSIFHLFKNYLGFTIISSLACSALIGFGSNVQGVINAFSGDDGWWGPSRVIKGAINEFPIWSFVLGDVHPHYLNLALFPFFLSLLFMIVDSKLNSLTKLAYIALFGIFGIAFTYNSNAWEVPMWGIFGLIFVGLFVKDELSKRQSFSSLKIKPQYVVFFLLSVLFLVLSSLNIKGTAQPATFVMPPIDKTTLKEIFLHIGFPLALITIFLIAQVRGISNKLLSLGLVLLSLAMYYAYGFLIVLLAINFIRIINSEEKESNLIAESLGILTIVLLLLPEAVFLNDSYGGDNERMNTIFKIYSFVWFPLHIFAFYLFFTTINKIKIAGLKEVPPPAIYIAKGFFILVIFGVSFSFLSQLVRIRTEKDISQTDLSEGLQAVEKQFPGAASTIRKLRSLPQGTTIEGQGNPYDWTSHVSTLANQRSFLGWANHVNLLVRDYEKVSRREKTSETVYTSQSCDEKKNILLTEKVKYLVLGPLERKKYKEISSPDTFSCLKLLHEDREYQLYEVG